mgnify:CR=1 FL=1
MVTKLTYIESDQVNPYKNLAVEEYLLLHCEDKECILYLWQNQNTVVIGRNQNAWKECKVTKLEEENGHLARRLSGGGAVYHDLGNLNFTFLVNKDEYSLGKAVTGNHKCNGTVGIESRKIRKKRHLDRWKEILRQCIL